MKLISPFRNYLHSHGEYCTELLECFKLHHRRTSWLGQFRLTHTTRWNDRFRYSSYPFLQNHQQIKADYSQNHAVRWAKTSGGLKYSYLFTVTARILARVDWLCVRCMNHDLTVSLYQMFAPTCSAWDCLLTRTSAARCTQKAHYWSPHPRETQIVVAAAPKEENAQMIFVYLKCPSLDWIHLKWDKATESSLIQRLTWRPTVPVMVQIIRTVLTRHQTREKILYACMCVCTREREAENVLVL